MKDMPQFTQGDWYPMAKVLFTDGDWQLIEDKYRGEKISTAIHNCKDNEQDNERTMFSWGPSANVLKKGCSKCDAPVPETIAGLWRLHNFDKMRLLEKLGEHL